MNPLDPKDLRIVELLLEDARMSNRDLARALGIAESSTLERVRKLERRGVIRGAHAEIDLAALGAHLEVMILVRLSSNSRSAVETFRDDMLALPEIRAVYMVSGESDFMVHVAVHDSDHLRELELDQITSRKEVESVQTSLIFEHRPSYSIPAP